MYIKMITNVFCIMETIFSQSTCIDSSSEMAKNHVQYEYIKKIELCEEKIHDIPESNTVHTHSTRDICCKTPCLPQVL